MSMETVFWRGYRVCRKDVDVLEALEKWLHVNFWPVVVGRGSMYFDMDIDIVNRIDGCAMGREEIIYREWELKQPSCMRDAISDIVHLMKRVGFRLFDFHTKRTVYEIPPFENLSELKLKLGLLGELT